jgi:1,6-anhydro-N-acetylmuramate kinase
MRRRVCCARRAYRRERPPSAARQTVWHEPTAPPRIDPAGQPGPDRARTGIRTVGDFRRRYRGRRPGAALAPLLHRALFRPAVERAVPNLGGIANVSIIDRGASSVSTPGRATACSTPGYVAIAARR